MLAARAQRAGDSLTVMLLDIDHFKTVNDLHGHVIGDAVLRGVAGAVTGELRAGDVFFRIGGDEFMILMPSTAPTAALALGDGIRAAAAATMATLLSNETAVTVSIGVVEVPPDELSARMVIECADVPLYSAKNLGGDCVVVSGRPQRQQVDTDAKHHLPPRERFDVEATVGDRSPLGRLPSGELGQMRSAELLALLHSVATPIALSGCRAARCCDRRVG